MTITTSPLLQRGMSIVELMISVAIGLMITLAVSSLFLSTNRSNKQNNDITLMQENGRFALETIAADIRHAGFFGNVQNPADINPNGVSMPSGTDCGSTALGSPYMLDFSTTQKLIGYSTGLSDSELTTLIAPCTLPTDVALPSTNNTILAVKRVSSASRLYTELGSNPLGADRIYVHSNGSTSGLGSGTDTPVPQNTTQIWEYMPRYYYVTNTHTLYRSTFNMESAGIWLDEPLAEGIERFHIEYGIDTDNEGTPNYFSDVPANIDFNNVVSARIHILARTTRADLQYDDQNTYTLGSFAVTPATDTTNTDPNKTHYHRQVYSTTVTIPNLRRRNTIN